MLNDKEFPMLWKLIFCLLVSLLIESPLLSADGPPKKIGIEIETSWIKVTKDTAGKSFSFFNNGGKKLWLLEPDTVDSSEEGYNLELKTDGGFENEHTFLPVLEAMTHALTGIYSSKTERLTIQNLQSFLPGKYPQDYSIRGEGWSKTGTLDLIFRNNGHTPPQVTYQLPLSMIPKVFERLAYLKHQQVSEFYNALNSQHFEKPVPPPIHIYDASVRDHYKFNILLHLLGLNFRDQLHSSEIFSNVKGMTYLFLYYWASLFNENLVCSKEPGLKSLLAVMSRIPLSELYKNGLNSMEKQQFQNIVGKLVGSLEAVPFNENTLINNTLRVYKLQNNSKYVPRLTIKEWYKSIIDPEQYGKKVIRQLEYNNESEEERHVDLLSPPPEFDPGYSMGLFLWEFTKSPLIEIRGYAKVREKKDKMFSGDVQNVKDFIVEEMKWFFGQK